jgi:WD40 repeat protein
MNRVLCYLRRPRPLLVGLFGVAIFLTWFGVWVRVLPIKPRVVIRAQQQLTLLGFSQDGKVLYTESLPSTAEAKHEIRIWDTAIGAELKRYLPGEALHVERQDGSNHLNGHAGSFEVIERKRNPRLFEFVAATAPFRHGALSSDGKTLAFTSWNPHSVAAWDLETDMESHGTKRCWAPYAAWSPDGKLLAYPRGTWGKVEIVVAEARTGRECCVLKSQETHDQYAFSPRSDMFAMCCLGSPPGGIVRVWSVADQRELFALPGAVSFTFSPDGECLATRHFSNPTPSADSVMRVWDTNTWR